MSEIEQTSDTVDRSDPDHPVFNIAPPTADVEDDIAKVAEDVAIRGKEAQRRTRRAMVNRVIAAVRVEQLGLSGPNDSTDVEELTSDAMMRALDLYVQSRPKASAGSISFALDTLEKMHRIGEK